jgi:hypothetical protein
MLKLVPILHSTAVDLGGRTSGVELEGEGLRRVVRNDPKFRLASLVRSRSSTLSKQARVVRDRAPAFRNRASKWPTCVAILCAVCGIHSSRHAGAPPRSDSEAGRSGKARVTGHVRTYGQCRLGSSGCQPGLSL